MGVVYGREAVEFGMLKFLGIAVGGDERQDCCLYEKQDADGCFDGKGKSLVIDSYSGGRMKYLH